MLKMINSFPCYFQKRTWSMPESQVAPQYSDTYITQYSYIYIYTLICYQDTLSGKK